MIHQTSIMSYDSTSLTTAVVYFTMEEISEDTMYVDLSNKWDNKAFHQLTLHQCRRIFANEKLQSVIRVTKMVNRQMRERRKYNQGVRYAMCDTRVI